MDGLLYVFTGDGKGKTSAAIGIAVRAAGHNKKVAFFQFMKENSPKKGEYLSLSSLPNVEIARFGSSLLSSNNAEEAVTKKKIEAGLEYVVDYMNNNEVDVLVLDEINVVLDKKLVNIEKIQNLLKYRERNVDIIMTGRNAPAAIIEQADLVTELKNVKHPYDAGIGAKRGLDY